MLSPNTTDFVFIKTQKPDWCQLCKYGWKQGRKKILEDQLTTAFETVNMGIGTLSCGKILTFDVHTVFVTTAREMLYFKSSVLKCSRFHDLTEIKETMNIYSSALIPALSQHRDAFIKQIPCQRIVKNVSLIRHQSVLALTVPTSEEKLLGGEDQKHAAMLTMFQTLTAAQDQTSDRRKGTRRSQQTERDAEKTVQVADHHIKTTAIISVGHLTIGLETVLVVTRDRPAVDHRP